MLMTVDQLPDVILAIIFERLPLRDVHSCAGVCRRWRRHLWASPRWRSFQLALNARCHADIPIHDFVFLLGIEKVKLTAVIPFALTAVMPGDSRPQQFLQFCAIPFELLRGVLTHCAELRELDLSAMRLFPGMVTKEIFESLWTRGGVGTHELTGLALPKCYTPSVEYLEAVFKAHPRLERLSLCLEWLCLSRDDVSIIVTHLRPGLKSLTITGPNVSATQLQQAAFADNLAHLHLSGLSFSGLELVLKAFRNIRSLKVERVELKLGKLQSPKLRLHSVHSANDVSQSLEMVDLGLCENNDFIWPTRGDICFPRLMEVFGFCGSLKELSLSPPPKCNQSYYVEPATLASVLVGEPSWGPKITSISLRLTTEGEWTAFEALLPKMLSLRALYLHVMTGLPHVFAGHVLRDCATRTLGSLYLRRADDILPLVYLWRSVNDLFFRRFWDDGTLGEIAAPIPARWGLRKLECIGFNLRAEPTHLASLRNVKSLTLHPYKDIFRNVACSDIVRLHDLAHLLPFVETLKIHGKHRDCFTGLTLEDLSAISGWKHLKECLLTVAVDREDLEGPPTFSEHFRDTFIRLKDTQFLPGLKAEWKCHLAHLELIDVNAGIIDPDAAPPRAFRPLIFASKCSLGKLHFVMAP